MRASLKTSGFSIALASLLLGLRVQAQTTKVGELIVLQETGPRDKRVNIVVVGDGYTVADKDKFKADIQVVANGVIRDLPLTEYAGYFNVYGIFVASNQTGADNPNQGISRDTYFGATYGSGGLERLLTMNDTKVFQVINAWVPEADMHFGVVNSDEYGGSGGPIAVAARSAPQIIAHESQHSFSALGDEYDYAGVSPWESPNTTQTTNRMTTRWAHWIEASTPIPTPAIAAYAKRIGIFEGAAYNPIGWFRPALDCRMRENGVPFCSVCSEAILLSMYDKISPIDSSFPTMKSVSIGTDQAPGLRIKPKVPSGHALAITWSVDGVLQADQHGAAFTRALSVGAHTVTARVSDTTPMIRKDPKHVASDTASWNVRVAAVSRTAASGTVSGLSLVRVDSKGLWLDLPEAAEIHLTLSSINGASLEARTLRGRPGPNHIAWVRASGLARGAYIAELESGNVSVRRRFLVR